MGAKSVSVFRIIYPDPEDYEKDTTQVRYAPLKRRLKKGQQRNRIRYH
jgi:hypothetical protein